MPAIERQSVISSGRYGMWIAIVIGIVAVVALAAVLFFRSQPRMQHYMFAHDVVPRAVLADPVACLPHLLSNGRSIATKSQLLAGWRRKT